MKSPYLTVSLMLWLGMAGMWGACGDSEEPQGCREGDGASLVMTLSPATGAVYADGTATFSVSIFGKDTECQPLPAGSEIELRIIEASEEGVGVFVTNDDTTLVVKTGALGTSTLVKSAKAGTAKVSAFSAEYNLTATPVELNFSIPPASGQCAVSLAVDPSVIVPDGASTSSATATLVSDAGGLMPDGTEVRFTTTLGKFVESGQTEHTTTSVNSIATATLQSELLTEDSSAEVTVTFVCDSGEQKSNDQTVRFGLSDEPVVNLRASSNEVLADNVSTVDLTAEVFLVGGTKAGADVEVDFVTDLGYFKESGNQQLYTALTDADGVAVATFQGGSEQGMATVSAGVFVDQIQASDDVEINVRALGAVGWVSSTPEKLGVKGSGRNESSNIIFQLLDSANQPMTAGVLVEFSTSDAPGVGLDPLTARTDSLGFVDTNLSSGFDATSVTVKATAHVGSKTIVGESPSLAIVGAKPSGTYFDFVCEQLNVGGFRIIGAEVACTAYLADRHSHIVGFATSVLFKVEAGAIDGTAQTPDEGVNIGVASTFMRTQDPKPPDVPAIANEPFIGSANPRDGLVTVIAYTTGEEGFTDLNGNSQYDVGEDFDDLGEPFVDANDNGTFEPGEKFKDANESGSYDGPNGVWDSDTLIWDQTWILWTGPVAVGDPATDCGNMPGDRYSVLCPPDFNSDMIRVNQVREFRWEIKDARLNPINSTLDLDVKVDGSGTRGASSPLLPFRASDTIGGDWANGGGFWGTVLVVGASSASAAPEPGSVTLEFSWKDSPGIGDTFESSLTSMGLFE